MVEASALAAAGAFEASQRSAMARTSSGSALCAAVASTCEGLLGAAQVAQHGGLQVLRPDVQRVGVDRAVDKVRGPQLISPRPVAISASE